MGTAVGARLIRGPCRGRFRYAVRLWTAPLRRSLTEVAYHCAAEALDALRSCIDAFEVRVAQDRLIRSQIQAALNLDGGTDRVSQKPLELDVRAAAEPVGDVRNGRRRGST